MDKKILEAIYDDLANATIDYQKSIAYSIQEKDELETLRLAKVATGEIQGKNADEREANTRVLLAVPQENYVHALRSERNAKLAYDLASLRLDQAKQTMRLMELEAKKDPVFSFPPE
jgi:hypothetical protein